MNIAATEHYGHPVYHYHLHVVALLVVEKEIRWTKRCKDPALVGTVKEVIQQVSHSKKWKSEKALDENGNTVLVKSYSILQDKFFEYMSGAGYEDFVRGERGSTAENLTPLQYKISKDKERLPELEQKISDERYATMTEALGREQSELKSKVPQMEAFLSGETDKSVGLQKFIEKVKRLTEFTELTPEIVHEYVEKIEVHAPRYVDGKRVQLLDIYFSSAGIVREMTPEEMEEAFQKRLKAEQTKTA